MSSSIPFARLTESLSALKVSRDLTEKRLAQEALRQSEEQFKHLVLGVTDYAIYMLDPEGIITNWNAGAQRIKGYLPEEIVGKHFSIFFEPQARQSGEPERSLRIALAEGRFENRAWRVRKDGTRFFANVVLDPIHDDSGQLLGFAKITRDITESEEAQQALDAAREALFHAKKMEALGQLTGGVAHDFNNLLMVILGSMELIRRRSPSDGKITALLDNAIQAAERGATLTRRMLAFARRQQLSLDVFDLTEMIRGMAELLRTSLGALVQVGTRFPLILSAVRADRHQLELAVLNLAVNARDAMPEGGALIIEARDVLLAEPVNGLQVGTYVCLSLTDTGEGMDEATLSKATDPFFTTKEIGKGTGLGLSMVDGVAAQVGGKLVMRSQRPGGTTAELWIPAAKASAKLDLLPSPADAEPNEGNGQRVLLVDDDTLVLVSTKAMLEEGGYVVEAVTSAEQALALLAQAGEKIDYLITDNLMPGMCGPELVSRAQVLYPDLRALLASGYEDAEGSASDIPQLAKPFNHRRLMRALEALGK
ncbi:PAS domain S-box protein [Pseudomonas savastanoi pv. glycinea]|nr:PAS domain S-box protein [Pseudomonas savastanoi pv. glycinea]RMO42117.1 PAS domain S-box protein [Pseudomonas savastanoi pv. glycinea]RMP55664.1 PAS domain S-box protein [Pseudomonas savastanoi pv. glycinea]RMP85583.1 PAS domain S-box protein [Pseudomonas savastanoi pv. glycinea]RMP94403.1 PAS domain S-box protein [Pseudomonas savastanoi pv. glycinea]